MADFSIHPSAELVRLFKERPYQGADPAIARVIFLGNDANYSAEISNTPFFNYILEYHKDGVAFWKKYGVHHPFLLSDYPLNKTKGGVNYHRAFSKIGIKPACAGVISFVELLDIPTTGVSGSNPNLLKLLINKKHLENLEAVFLSEQKKIVICSSGFIRFLQTSERTYNCFSSFSGLLSAKINDTVKINENCSFYYSYHCSYGKFHTNIPNLVKAIRPYLSE